MLFKLSVKNIRRSIKDYAIYFFTLILGIAIFYVFNAISTQAAFLKMSMNTKEIVKLLTTMISGVSVFVAFVLGFLVVYASRFLVRRRNKEFALYMILGMSKREIAGILAMETVLIGLLSLVVGLGVGIGASQIMSTVVAQMFDADMTTFTFTFSKDAFLKTILYFAIIMLVVALFDLFTVGRSKLIDLMQTGSRAEKVRMKHPVLCAFVFLLGAGVLTYAYRMVTVNFARITNERTILVPIALGTLGTFLVFWSVSGLLLVIFSTIKGSYYRGVNSFTFRQISSRVNTMVVSMSVICLMLFVTLGVLSGALSLRSYLNQDLKENTPVDAEITKSIATPDSRADMLEGLTENGTPEELAEELVDWDIPTTFEMLDEDMGELFGEYELVSYYGTRELTFGDALGDTLSVAKLNLPQLAYDLPETIMTVGDYNRIARLYGNETYGLAEDEYLMLCTYDPMMQLRNPALETGTILQVFGKELHPKYSTVMRGYVNLATSSANAGIILIPDDVPDPAYRRKELLFGNYQASDDAERQVIEEKLRNIVNHAGEKIPNLNWYLDGNTKIDIYISSVGIGAIVTFVGLYLGLVFLISGAAILALKALSDSIDSSGRYQMLRKLGTEERDIASSLFWQEAVLFLLPLLLACIHMIFGMQFIEQVLEIVGAESVLRSTFTTAIILVIIYGGYFLITYISSRMIIKERG